MKTKEKLILYYRTLRVNQWVKNLVVFTSVIFSGKLFEFDIFLQGIEVFLIFCLLSSTSYVLNDIIDYPYDKKHPIKKNRPIASGEVSIQQATFLVFILTLVSLIISLFYSGALFFLALIFLVLHFLYSLYLKKHPIVDIFSISFSFMIRALAGEIVTGFHIPIWLLLTIFFVSLFMATVKRHAELVAHGKEARASLYFYKEHLIDFLTTTFATMTIISYSFYTYFEKLPNVVTPFSKVFSSIYPEFEARKWMMVSIPFVVYGIARYAQLLYEKEEGEAPEKTITQDTPLVVTIFLWGFVVIGLIYLF